ncbi:MAG: hypothetical protein MJ099_02965, partial [Clostridia bacterium]|nr:hypothetical protein [Clostridia bacterium]
MYVGIDLGSTNIKAALYDKDMHLVTSESAPVEYFKSGSNVEFDAEVFFNNVLELLRKVGTGHTIHQIALTGQAETLVCVGKDGKPVMNAISWMDERSREECDYLAERFPADLCERVTGQQAVLPTWPATKILHLRNNHPDVFANTETFMLLKDFIVYRLTGKKVCDMSIATFTFYFDIYEKHYWKEMLDVVGIDETRL